MHKANPVHARSSYIKNRVLNQNKMLLQGCKTDALKSASQEK